MARRLVFYIDEQNNFTQKEIKFKWYPGFSQTQLEKSIKELHEKFEVEEPNKKILEVSSASSSRIAKKAGAFSLEVVTSHGKYSVEQLFQAGKVFKNHGSRQELLTLSSKDAKQANKEINSHDTLIGFKIFEASFPLIPKTYFYNWTYLKALEQNPGIASEIAKYDAFTDIFFNDQKSFNCQAQACSIYVSLLRRRLLKKALSSRNDFLKVVYGNSL